MEADLFVAGTELVHASERADAWAEVAAGVRAEFGGKVTYSANWGDEVARFDFTPFDYVGVSAYWPLTDRCDAPPGELAAGWRGVLSTLAGVADRNDRPPTTSPGGRRSGSDRGR
jgi:hypothetical protein